MALTVTSHKDQEAVSVRVEGEVDVSNASELRDELDAALASDAKSVTVDLSQVPYIDSTGIGVLVGTAHRAKDKGADFVVARPQHNVARVLGLLGVGEELHVSGA